MLGRILNHYYNKEAANYRIKHIEKYLLYKEEVQWRHYITEDNNGGDNDFLDTDASSVPDYYS